MISDLAIYERSYCECDQCRQQCREHPGALAPSDIDHIAAHEGLEEWDEDFLDTYFEACADGPGDAPVIRPRKKGDGSCVFLTTDGRCSIDAVKPFECGRLNACDSSGDDALVAMGSAISASKDYIQTHLQLWELQHD